MTPDRHADLVVVGAGIAGLTAALTAASAGARVLVVSAGQLGASGSALAQGGVAAATAADDGPEIHARDTTIAGRGLCRTEAVAILTAEAPARIADLRAFGVPFDDGLGLEGGHARRRIHHVRGTETGAAILAVLIGAARSRSSIECVEGERVIDLRPGDGLRTDRRSVAASAILLATGGYAALWARTTNPAAATGSGIALAHRSGAALADLEFVQFHPTVLAGSDMLLSEALRGEGARLLDDDGASFVDELAPRDVVARAVGARGTVLLDLRPVERARFPDLARRLVEAGHDPGSGPVPVTAAAHFTVGGIVTDLDGRTSVPGLYAAGECACTGLHGANRLASNSLAECLVFGRRAALAALRDRTVPATRPELRRGPTTDATSRSEPTVSERQDLLDGAGLVRNAAGLRRLGASPVPLIRLLAASALARRESRGSHFRSDFPELDPALDGHHTVIRPDVAPRLECWP